VRGASGPSDASGPIRQVTSPVGSLYELGRLRQGRRLYVYDEVTFLAVPGAYADLPYVRPEGGDENTDRATGYHLDLSDPATVFVAYDAESRPDWLAGWTDTGDTLGTEDGTRRIYRQQVAAGGTWLGGCPDTNRMYTVFVRSE